MDKEKVILMRICNTQKANNGSVLIITIVITGVLLSVGITLASILEKEITRQAYGRQSQLAMNIANSALECALFNDFHRFTFRSASLARRIHDSVDCGELYQVRSDSDWSSENVYVPSSNDKESTVLGTGRYQFVVIDSGKEDLLGESVSCALVAVDKQCVGSTSTVGSNQVCDDGLIKTSIEVRGYSVCSSGEDEDIRKLVRRFKVHY